MNKIYHSILALTLASVTSFNAVAHIPAVAQQKQVYISIGTDVLEHLQKKHPAAIQFNPVASLKSANREFQTLSINESQIPQLSQLIHQDFIRCPGFFLHETKQKALQHNLRAKQTHQLNPVDYAIDNGDTVYAMLSQISNEHLDATVNSLSEFHNRYYTRQTGMQAAQWIQSQWQTLSADRADINVELYDHDGWTQPSVIATIVGTETPDEYVVIGGHLDSINGSNATLGRAPGADDNASGIAVITETLRAIVAGDYRPAKTVVIIGYAAEEVGLRGSQEIAGAFRDSGKNVTGVVQFDMTGYQGSASTDIALVSDYTNSAQNQFLTQLMDEYLPEVNYSSTTCGYACSDHAAWNALGYPASFPFEAKMAYYNPKIHTSNDSEFEADHAFKFLKLSVTYLAELAKGSSGVNLVKGTVNFNQSQISVDEGETVTISVDRVGGQDTPVSIDFTTQDGNAVAGTDYTANSGTLNWADQDNSTREITITTADVSENKSFTVVLSNPQGGVALGTEQTMTVTIVDKTVAEPEPTPTPTPTPQAQNQSSGGGGSLSFLGLGLLLLGGLRARKGK